VVAAPIDLVFPVWERRGDEILVVVPQKQLADPKVTIKPPDPKTDPEGYRRYMLQQQYLKRLEMMRQIQQQQQGGENLGVPPPPSLSMGKPHMGKPPVPFQPISPQPLPFNPNAETVAENKPKELGNITQGSRGFVLEWRKTKESAGLPFAEHILPSRAVLVVASFPYERQMEKIRESLSLADRAQVPTLFQRLEVQKRLIVPADILTGQPDRVFLGYNPDGTVNLKPLSQVGPEEGWINVDLDRVVMHTRDAASFEWEADAAYRHLRAVNSRLVAWLPKLARGQYPLVDLYNQLSDIQSARKQVEDQFKGRVQPPPEDPRLRDRRFDGFGEDPSQMPAPPMKPEMSGEMNPPVVNPPVEGGVYKPFNPNPVVKPAVPETTGEGPSPVPLAITNWPRSSILRFLDVDRTQMLGGTGWQYRMRVVLRNPNYRKTDVSDPRDALVEELVGGWSPPSGVVTFPQDTYLYVREKDSSERKPNPSPVLRAQQAETVGLQVHRWLTHVRRQGAALGWVEERVGEWGVANLLVGRGEIIGQMVEAPLAVWSPNTPKEGGGFGRFTVVDKAKTDAFSLGKFEQPTLLVDFESPDTAVLMRTGMQVRMPPEQVPTEALIMLADGRLICRNLRTDSADAERKARETSWFTLVGRERKERDERSKEPTKPNTGPFTKPAVN